MTRARFHGLRKAKVRATWNKYNLYNLSRIRLNRVEEGTFYQQKWKAKSISRAYHGEQVREKQWERMFRPRANSVIPMDPYYLAEHDGSELAEGRGSGKDVPLVLDNIKFKTKHIPHMSMVYAPTERRLDVAIWRALFASSARQARQFVTHGKVKVNGKKMPYPGYLLNPGDMFQVDPDRVLFATGTPKPREQARLGRGMKKQNRVINKNRVEGRINRQKKIAAAQEKFEEAASTDAPQPSLSSATEEQQREKLGGKFKELQGQIQSILADNKAPPSGKRKTALRKLHREIRATLGKSKKKTLEELQTLRDEYSSHLAIYNKLPDINDASPSAPEPPLSPPTKADQEALQAAIQRARENPIDETKPYATPWAPRPYMSAFAFIPRYLEVNHQICSAVYLRHPVARPGSAEVPSPFPERVLQLAHNWYLRRR